MTFKIVQEGKVTASIVTPNLAPLIPIRRDFLLSSKVLDQVPIKEKMEVLTVCTTPFQDIRQKVEEYLTEKLVSQVNFGNLQTLQVQQTMKFQLSLVGPQNC